VPAPAAAGRGFPTGTPRTPSKSRSTCGPTAGSSAAGGTSGPAPATVPRPSPPRPSQIEVLQAWNAVILVENRG
jgi:hypothetical protein